MGTVVITGASDDLIEIEGELREEFSYHNEDDGDLLAFSDGTVLRIKFDGVWRITPVVRGPGSLLTIEQADEDDEGTDTATLDLVDELKWVVQGLAIAKAKS
jgi:hypothetical protein